MTLYGWYCGKMSLIPYRVYGDAGKMQSHLQLFRKVITEYFGGVFAKLFFAGVHLNMHSHV